MQLVMKHIPPLTLEEELNALDWAQNRLLAAGIVEVQDAWIDPGMTEVYLEAAKRDRLRVTTNLAFRADPATWLVDFEYFDEMQKQVVELNHSSLKANAIKFFVDGVLGSSTASVVEPYIAGPAKHTHGEQVWRFEELSRAVSEATRRGYQLHLHAIGDAAVQTALDVIEQVGPIIPAVIAHTELIADSDLPRFAKLNVTANFEPLWAREDGQLLTCVPQLGRERLDSMYRMRDLADAGGNRDRSKSLYTRRKIVDKTTSAEHPRGIDRIHLGCLISTFNLRQLRNTSRWPARRICSVVGKSIRDFRSATF
jgi:predicted amidohydrolase YtcJ